MIRQIFKEMPNFLIHCKLWKMDKEFLTVKESIAIKIVKTK